MRKPRENSELYDIAEYCRKAGHKITLRHGRIIRIDEAYISDDEISQDEAEVKMLDIAIAYLKGE